APSSRRRLPRTPATPVPHTPPLHGALPIFTENALDRHLENRGNKLALIWEPNDPKERFVRLTYREVYERVCEFANALKAQGIRRSEEHTSELQPREKLVCRLLVEKRKARKR